MEISELAKQLTALGCPSEKIRRNGRATRQARRQLAEQKGRSYEELCNICSV